MDGLQSSKASLVFDLGGVIFDTDTRTIVNRACKQFDGAITPEEIKNFFIEFAQIKPIKHHKISGRNEAGRLYPPLLNDFLVGVPSKQILAYIAEQKGTNSRFWQLASLIFNPHVLAQLYVIIPQGEQFVKECARQGYPLYILSNWDVDSFPLVREKYKTFFDLFSGIVISAECQLIKPDPAIYKLLLQRYQLNPQRCFFVDNQQENIEVAQSMGMHGILCPEGNCGPDFDRVKRTLGEQLNGK